jgi:hypothetical protein
MSTLSATTPAPRALTAQQQQQATLMMQDCIDRCLACQRGCIMTLTHLRDLGGAHIDPFRVRSLLDCADACQVAATFMMRGSHRHIEMCAVAARICRDAADRCEGTTVEQLRKCVDAARSCETACRELINAKAENPTEAK